MDKATFMDQLRAGRAEWDALLADIPTDRMEQPPIEGDLSIKDIIAHVTWYEREVVEVMRARSLAVGSDLWYRYPDQDQRNAAVLEQIRGRPLSAVLDEARQMSQQLLAAAETLADDELNDPGRFAEMPGDWVPWNIIAGNSFDHYPDHIRSIRAWLGQETRD